MATSSRPPSPHDVPPRTIALIVGVMLAGLAIGMLLVMPHYGPRQPRRRSALGHVMPTSMIGQETNGMMWIPGGTFVMGSKTGPPDEAAHEVSLAPFWMDKTEVTVGEYARFAAATGRDPLSGDTHYPIASVNWVDASAYAQWAGKRLPTEAEWEYAARGGLNQQTFVWGDQPPSTNLANINATGPVKAGGYPPNGYGVLDLAGNVSEWCSDWYDAAYYKSSPKLRPRGPLEPRTERVIRGGSYLSTTDRELQVSARAKAPQDTARPEIGLRCVRDAL